jgi:hypothetical protein
VSAWGEFGARPRNRHCGGCNGFGPAWEGDCEGISPDEFGLAAFRYAIPPRLPWRFRWRVLLGRGVETHPAEAILESGNICD